MDPLQSANPLRGSSRVIKPMPARGKALDDVNPADINTDTPLAKPDSTGLQNKEGLPAFLAITAEYNPNGANQGQDSDFVISSSLNNLSEKVSTGTILAQRYQIEGFLGQGGMAQVYSARDFTQNRKIAIKLLKATTGSVNVSLIERFAREGETMQKLSHPHILPVYSLGEHNGTQYIAMELMEAGTLRSPRFVIEEENLVSIYKIIGKVLKAAQAKDDSLEGLSFKNLTLANAIELIENNFPAQESGITKEQVLFILNSIKRLITMAQEQGKIEKTVKPDDYSLEVLFKIFKKGIGKDLLTLEQKLLIVADICDALQYAHQHDAIHRDVKPENILLSTEVTHDKYTVRPIAKLGDFGLVLVPDATRISKSQDILGSVYYISPEQTMGHRNLTGLADLYSIGIILYELVSGKVPFDGGGNLLAVLEQQKNEIPKPLSTLDIQIPPGLEPLIMTLLQKKPSDRHFKSAREVSDELRRIA